MKSLSRILFVCHDNVFRSALAECCCKMALNRLDRASAFEVLSRGITGIRNVPPPIHSHPSAYPEWRFALPHLNRLGISLDDHRATPVRDEDMQYAHAIVAMDRAVLQDHEYSLSWRYPDDRDRMHLFDELDGLGDVDDLQYATSEAEGEQIVERVHTTMMHHIDKLLSWAQQRQTFAPL